jgi:hypothetical protein
MGLLALDHLRAIHVRGPVRTGDAHPHEGLNRVIAVGITNRVGSMWAAYLFCLLSLVSLPAAIASGNVIVIVAWVAQTFLQLVLLPVIIVGQNVQAAHSDARAEVDHEVLGHQVEVLASLHGLQVEQTAILRRLDPSGQGAGKEAG